MPANTMPSAETLFRMRFEEKNTWGEIRDATGLSYRSSRFLAEIGEYVRQDADLLAKYPEFADLSGAESEDAEVRKAAREAIRNERLRGVGFAVLADRTGLTVAKIRAIVGEEVGTTARRAYGARYGAPKRIPAATEEEGTDAADSAGDADSPDLPGEIERPASDAEIAAATADVPDLSAVETPAPAPKRRSRKRAAQSA